MIKKLIIIPEKIKIYKKENYLVLVGLRKNLVNLPKDVIVNKKNNLLKIELKNKEELQFFNTWFYNLENLIKGLDKQYRINLILKGLGFKAKIRKKKYLLLKLGYSHSVKFKLAAGLKLKILKKINIRITGTSKEKLNNQGNQLKILRMPDSYKGKGIIFRGEKLKLKQGKKA